MPERPQLPDSVDLTDERIRLRRWTSDDVGVLMRAINDQEIVRWIPDIPVPFGGMEAESLIENATADWAKEKAAHLAIEDLSTSELVGSIGLVRIDWVQRVAEIGYWIAAEKRGLGFGRASLIRISRWAFDDLGFRRLELYIDPANSTSLRLAEACGFQMEGRLRGRYQTRDGGRNDSAVYGLLASDVNAVTAGSHGECP